MSNTHAATGMTHPGAPGATGASQSAHGSTAAGAKGMTNNAANAKSGTAGRPGMNAAGAPNAKNATAGRPGAGAAAGARNGMNAKTGPGAAGANQKGVTQASLRSKDSAHHMEAPRQVKQVGNKTVAYDNKHQLRDIKAPGMEIHRGLNGERHIVTTHNGRTIVTQGRRGGYAERAYLRRNGREYVQRTYVYGGRSYAVAYRSYYYGGARYYSYVPPYYYGPAYYGWAYNPWPQPVYYNWGWQQYPWYNYYGSYYQPYPSYPTASSWITDYMLAENLKAAYAAAQQTAALDRQPRLLDAAYWGSSGAAAGTALSADVKKALTDEVKQQIADEQQNASSANAASSGGENQAPPALDPKHTIFVVYTNLDVPSADGQECELTGGDIINRTSDQATDDGKVDVVVKSSKKGDCAVGTNTQVATNDLQEMHNHLRELVDGGLKELAQNSGKNGLPTAPDTKTTAGEVPPPSPDSNASSDLQSQQNDADQTEKQVASAGTT